MGNIPEKEPEITINNRIYIKGEAAKKILDRQAEALQKGVRISVSTAIEKLILGK